MTKNPHPEFIEDEASGFKVPSQRHEDWEAGRNSLKADLPEILWSLVSRQIQLLEHPEWFQISGRTLPGMALKPEYYSEEEY